MEARQLCQSCFILLLVIGIGCILGGPLLDKAVEAAKLDSVLSPEELRDDKLREHTQDLIKRTEKQYWPVWLVLGAIIVTVSGVGLRASAATKIK